tara:strand:- start:2115 stop:2435 length:321 start_codon:yes stop_codon:yes gene_type:complete
MQQQRNKNEGSVSQERYHNYIQRKLREERKMAYDWPKIHKAEENIEMQITDWVYEHVLEYFGVEEVTDLTEENIIEVQAFWDSLNEYNCMGIGYSSLINNWEAENG